MRPLDSKGYLRLRLLVAWQLWALFEVAETAIADFSEVDYTELVGQSLDCSSVAHSHLGEMIRSSAARTAESHHHRTQAVNSVGSGYTAVGYTDLADYMVALAGKLEHLAEMHWQLG